MEEVKFLIDKDCQGCKEGLGYLTSLYGKHKDCYASINTKTNEVIPAIVLRPDYNSAGFLTNWHITKEKEAENK